MNTVLSPSPETVAGLRAHYPVVIDGKELEAEGGTLPLINPRTGEEFATTSRGGKREIDLAVKAAQRALPEWRAKPALERGRLLHAVARKLREEAGTLGPLETLNTGRKNVEGMGDIEASAQMFEFYGGLAAGIEGSVFESTRPNTFSYEIREPFGVCGHIIPWNGPLLMTARGLAPALAAGNTIVAKPAEETPITIIELERIAREVGIPAGVINVVTGLGEEAGAALAEHPDIPRITFTGSLETGRLIQQAASPRMCHLTLELGGKSPNIIFADANLETALNMASVAITVLSGQACVAGSRLLVAEEIHEQFVEGLTKRFAEMRDPGDGVEPVSPLISSKQFDRVRGYIDKGVAEGAELTTEEQPDDASGFYVAPALFDNVTPDMTIFKEEIFGPVLAVTPFSSEEEAIRLANDTAFGLAAGLWTGSASRILRVAQQLEVGMIYVNGYLNAGVEAPFGGYKLSGIGHEKGRLAMDEYLRVKAITISYEDA